MGARVKILLKFHYHFPVPYIFGTRQSISISYLILAGNWELGHPSRELEDQGFVGPPHCQGPLSASLLEEGAGRGVWKGGKMSK